MINAVSTKHPQGGVGDGRKDYKEDEVKEQLYGADKPEEEETKGEVRNTPLTPGTLWGLL